MGLGTILGLGGISALGSVLGGITGSSSASKAQGMASVMSGAGTKAQLDALTSAKNIMAPYTMAGQYAVPQLLYLITGQNPYEWDENLEAWYQKYAPQRARMEADYARLMGTGSSNYRKVRRAQNEASNVQARLNRLDEIEAQRRGYYALKDYEYTNMPGFEYKQEQGEKALNRILRAKGRGNSSLALTTLGDYNRALISEDFQTQLSNLFNLANMGQGASAQVSGAEQNTASALSSLLQRSGETSAQMIKEAGEARGSLYSNLGAMPLELYRIWKIGQETGKKDTGSTWGW